MNSKRERGRGEGGRERIRDKVATKLDTSTINPPEFCTHVDLSQKKNHPTKENVNNKKNNLLQ